ncbi:MAG: NADH-quinone oxidoreductase subunit M [Pseudomonadota bacterium]
MDNLLSITIFIPAIAAVILAIFLRGDDAEAQGNAKWVAFIASSMTFLVSLFILFEFDAGDPGFQFREEHEWVFGITYRVGVDGISLWLVMLTTILMPLIIAGSWGQAARTKGFMIALLMAQTLILGAFLSLDVMFFFIFAETALIPLMMMLAIWGGDGGRTSAVKLLLYALPGAVVMLVAMVVMVFDAGTTDIEALMTHQFSDTISPLWMALAFLVPFAVKLPIWPLHVCFAGAATGAGGRMPLAGVIVMVALMTKLGAFGILRFVMPMFPEGAVMLSDILMWLSIALILYAALVAMAQNDLMQLFVYAGLGHMGFVLLGMMSATQQGVDGALFAMVSHGVVITALMLVLAALNERVGSTDIAAYGGVAAKMPLLAFGALIFTLASLGVPATSGFIGTVLIMVGMFEGQPILAALALLGVALLAAALLRVMKQVMFGPLIKQSLKDMTALSRREICVFAALFGVILYLGLFPGVITETTGATVDALVQGYADARD